jgi:hypothetical protein
MPPDPKVADAHLDLLVGVERLLKEADHIRDARDRLLQYAREQDAREAAKRPDKKGADNAG